MSGSRAGQQARDGYREQAAQPDQRHPERKAAAFHGERARVIAGEDPDEQHAEGRGQGHRGREQASPPQRLGLAREAGETSLTDPHGGPRLVRTGGTLGPQVGPIHVHRGLELDDFGGGQRIFGRWGRHEAVSKVGLVGRIGRPVGFGVALRAGIARGSQGFAVAARAVSSAFCAALVAELLELLLRRAPSFLTSTSLALSPSFLELLHAPAVRAEIVDVDDLVDLALHVLS